MKTKAQKRIRDIKRNWVCYLMFIPVALFFIIFSYIPMYWIGTAFFDFVPRLGYSGSEFVGFKWFSDFFAKRDGWHLIWNTLKLNIWDVLISFCTPIILALLFFELSLKRLRNVIQTVTYLPHFISIVIICGMIVQFTKSDGLFSNIGYSLFRIPKHNILDETKNYIPIYIISQIWKEVGFASVIYYAALCSIDPSQFEAARIDGANRFQIMFRVTIPSILPTIVTMLILRMGSMLTVGFEKASLLQTGLNLPISEVLSTHVYNVGLVRQNYGYGTAVGLMNSVVNLVFLLITNRVAKRVGMNLF